MKNENTAYGPWNANKLVVVSGGDKCSRPIQFSPGAAERVTFFSGVLNFNKARVYRYVYQRE